MPKEGKLPLIKYAPPPSRLPVYQRIDPRDVSFFGRTNYEAALEEKKFIFGIKRIDRRHHVYAIGKAGVGKTKLLELLMRQDIAYGYGLCLIASHEDLVTSLLDFIPEERINDVIVVDPTDISYPISFNPLTGVPRELRHQFAQALTEVMTRQFGDSWSSRLEHLFRMLALALLDYPKATMRGMISILTEETYRADVVHCIEDDTVRRFWLEEFLDWKKSYDAEAVIPLLNKLGQRLSDPFLKHIFSQEMNTLDFHDIIQNQKVILVNLAGARLTTENGNFFGSLMLIKLRQAGMALLAKRPRDSKDFYLYIDDISRLDATILESLFVEAEQYHILIVGAHQYIAQLSRSTADIIFGNTGTIIVFRVGGTDAAIVEKELVPIFSAKDIMNLGEREFYIKMMIDGNTYDPFSAETLKIFPAPHDSFRHKIIARSRSQYAAGQTGVSALTS